MDAGGRTIALIVAAGSGTRTGGDVPKQYRTIGGKSVLAHAVMSFDHPAVEEIRVVIGVGQESLYQEAVRGLKVTAPIEGGATRQRSVRNGLEAIAAEGGAAKVLIHDAARPFVPRHVLEALVAALDEGQGAVPVLPVVDSLATRGGALGESVARDALVRVQTPQAFRIDAILAAHRGFAGPEDATDDAQVLRAAGGEVALVQGDPLLDKLTFEEDLERAEERLARRLVTRTGLGFDVHSFAPGEELWLGGLLIPHSKGLSGHSDADVALHAVTDALLGAIGAGDIGDHFPPSDPQWRGAPSSLFVEHARDLVDRSGGRIDHVDLTIICEAPRIGPHRAAMRERIAELLRVPAQRVSVKATTTERLGFTGRSEGMAAQAIATVRLPEER